MKKLFGLIICCFILCTFSSCEKEVNYFCAKKAQLNYYDIPNFYYNNWNVQDTIKIYSSNWTSDLVANPIQNSQYIAEFNEDYIGQPPYIGFYPSNISYASNFVVFPNIIDGSLTNLPMIAYERALLDNNNTLDFSFNGFIKIIRLQIVTQYNIYIESIDISIENRFINGVFCILYPTNDNPKFFLTHYDFDERGSNTTKINVQDSIQNKMFYIPIPDNGKNLINKITITLFTNEGIIKRCYEATFHDLETRFNLFLQI